MASAITNPYRFFRKHTADLIPIFWSEILPVITWKVSISTAEIDTDEANLFSNIIYLGNQLVSIVECRLQRSLKNLTNNIRCDSRKTSLIGSSVSFESTGKINI